MDNALACPYNEKFDRGFTLIELMIVVAIIGILAAIAIPKFAELIRKSQEGKTKGNLGGVRSALSIYYAEMEGQYPSDNLSSLTVGGRYLSAIPSSQAPNYHPEDSLAIQSTSLGCGIPAIHDSGQWMYWSDVSNMCGGLMGRHFGDVWVDCTHTDTKGTSWSNY